MEGGSIVLNATAEFCRTLGDIPTYGLAGNRDEDAQELLVSVTWMHMTTLDIRRAELHIHISPGFGEKYCKLQEVQN